MYRLQFNGGAYVAVKSHDTLGSAMKTAKREIASPDQTAWKVEVVVQEMGGRDVALKLYYNYANLAAHARAVGPAPASPARIAIQASKARARGE